MLADRRPNDSRLVPETEECDTRSRRNPRLLTRALRALDDDDADHRLSKSFSSLSTPASTPFATTFPAPVIAPRDYPSLPTAQPLLSLVARWFSLS